MALGSHGARKEGYGAADAAWNDSGSSSSSLSPEFGERQKQSESGNSRLSEVKDTSLSALTTNASAISCCRCTFLEIPPSLILEIFTHLDARELCVVSCVCSLFRRLSSDSHGWKDFYCERWGLPAPFSSGGAYLTLPGKLWRDLYVAREARSKAMMGRFRMDMLHGHTAAVRCVRLLPAANLICTAGYDQTVRLWNLEEGLPISCSRSLGETIRSIALDTDNLAVAGTDAVIRVWHALSDCPHLFDIAGVWNPIAGRGAECCLYGHTGPVTCLDLDSANLYSGSWDMSLKIWDRSSLKCKHTLRHMDWVWSLVQRGRRLLSTAGNYVVSWDAETLQQLRVRRGVHAGQAYAVEGSRSGHIVFTGGEDGAVRMFDDRIGKRRHALSEPSDDQSCMDLSGQREAVASWYPHSNAVYSLAFEDPWLVSASGDGSLGMMDIRHILRRVAGSSKSSVSRFRRRSGHYFVSKESAQRKLGGFHLSAYSVDVGAERVVSAGEEKVVRIWDFSQALEIERRVQASRSNHFENRMRRKHSAAALAESKGKQSDLSNDTKREATRKSDAGGRTDKEGLHKEAKEWQDMGKSVKTPVLKKSDEDLIRTSPCVTP